MSPFKPCMRPSTRSPRRASSPPAPPPRGDATRGWRPTDPTRKTPAKTPAVADPLGEEFNYAKAFLALDLAAVKQGIAEVLATSRAWWPADFGHYGPLMIRMAWH